MEPSGIARCMRRPLARLPEKMGSKGPRPFAAGGLLVYPITLSEAGGGTSSPSVKARLQAAAGWGERLRSCISLSTASIAATKSRMSSGVMAPMQPTRKLGVGVL